MKQSIKSYCIEHRDKPIKEIMDGLENSYKQELDEMFNPLISQKWFIRSRAIKNMILSNITPENESKIIRTVCEYYAVDFSQLYSKSRKREIVIPRQVTMYFLKKYTRMPRIGIGYKFNRDHTTVIHALKTINDLSTYDYNFKKDIETIDNLIKEL